jgi:RsiW-degrading membrane proteinase PrsW (M82 family)
LNAASLLLWLVTLAAPIAGAFAVLVRLRRRVSAPSLKPERLRTVLGTAALGALLFGAGWLLEQRLRAWVGLDERAKVTDLAMLLYAFLVAAPLEQGLKVVAIAPVWRSRHFRTPIDGIVYAAAAALGFISAHNAVFLLSGGASLIQVARALIAVPAHLFFAAMWGYMLGRDREKPRDSAEPPAKRRLGGRAFNLTWLGATVFNGVFDHLVFARGKGALIAAAPILLCMTFVAFGAARDLRKTTPEIAPPTRRRRLLRSIASPSMRAVRAALSRAERPLMIRWIGYGALVQAGVITASLAAAVALGHRIGVDFAAVDRGDTGGAASVAPLVLLGGATLSAFPIAGYLVARASSTQSVLEPAIAAALAIIGALVLLGLAAPITVVFAIAFAPVAFGLACAGAWVGITR